MSNLALGVIRVGWNLGPGGVPSVGGLAADPMYIVASRMAIIACI